MANELIQIDKKAIWEQILSKAHPLIDRGHLLTIFVNSAILSYQEGVLVIGFASIIGPDYVKEKYHHKIFPIIKEILLDLNEIQYEMKSSLVDAEYPDKLSIDVFMNVIGTQRKQRKVPNKQEVVLEGGMRSKILNKRYTLQNFIPGSENRLVHAACMAVGAKPAGIYNPLYVYGGVGLGKTHLLQATGHEILKNFPEKRVVYMTAEHFINKIVEAIGKKHTKPFKDEYRNLDCLIVDDIQFFANKATSEQEFFHTFNDLYDNGKQIILSADRPPRELEGFDDRLKSRFGMGMLIEVSKPSFETRLAILKAKCAEYQVMIDPEVVEFIAFNVTHSVREMIGVLVTAIGEAQLENATPTIRTVAQVIRKLCRDQEVGSIDFKEEQKRVARSLDDVIDIVARYFGLTKSELIGADRKKEIMMPRQISMYLIREILNQSYEAIGETFGGRNHTTVMHACNKVISQIKDDQNLSRDINALKKELGF
ncbi:chromosomal replication initiator protein DnaA [Candidatus Peregrinibacteria bacterium]|nr:chromosomal replication initiator protein DnaA [Candidatus Peregrinibacteria bacterium]